MDVLEILEALQALTPLASYRSETGLSCLAATNSPTVGRAGSRKVGRGSE